MSPEPVNKPLEATPTCQSGGRVARRHGQKSRGKSAAERALTLTERGRKPLAVDALKAFLTALVLTALARACGTDGGTQPGARGDSTPAVKRVWPDSWPVPPLTVMALEHPGRAGMGLPPLVLLAPRGQARPGLPRVLSLDGAGCLPGGQSRTGRSPSGSTPRRGRTRCSPKCTPVTATSWSTSSSWGRRTPCSISSFGPRGLPHPPDRAMAVQRDDRLRRTTV